MGACVNAWWGQKGQGVNSQEHLQQALTRRTAPGHARPPQQGPTLCTCAMGDTLQKRWMSSAVGPAPARFLPSSVPHASTNVQSGMSETGGKDKASRGSSWL